MNPQTYIGCPVTVILREGSYHGTIHRFDSVDKRITLRDGKKLIYIFPFWLHVFFCNVCFYFVS